MKCYVELPCDNIEIISKQIYQFIKEKTDILNTTKYGWHFIDCRELLNDAPDLFKYFKNNKLVPRHAAVTIITNNTHLARHIDEPTVIAKINFPVSNTNGWANRWYVDNIVVAELLDMSQPIVFNSQIEHSVEQTTLTEIPRIVASFTFHNEPLEWLE
jgi:hypothetical protein